MRNVSLVHAAVHYMHLSNSGNIHLRREVRLKVLRFSVAHISSIIVKKAHILPVADKLMKTKTSILIRSTGSTVIMQALSLQIRLVRLWYFYRRLNRCHFRFLSAVVSQAFLYGFTTILPIIPNVRFFQRHIRHYAVPRWRVPHQLTIKRETLR